MQRSQRTKDLLCSTGFPFPERLKCTYYLAAGPDKPFEGVKCQFFRETTGDDDQTAFVVRRALSVAHSDAIGYYCVQRMQRNSQTQLSESELCGLFAVNNMANRVVVTPEMVTKMSRDVAHSEWETFWSAKSVCNQQPQMSYALLCHVARVQGVYLVPVVLDSATLRRFVDTAPIDALVKEAGGFCFLIDTQNNSGHYYAVREHSGQWYVIDSLALAGENVLRINVTGKSLIIDAFETVLEKDSGASMVLLLHVAPSEQLCAVSAEPQGIVDAFDALLAKQTEPLGDSVFLCSAIANNTVTNQFKQRNGETEHPQCGTLPATLLLAMSDGLVDWRLGLFTGASFVVDIESNFADFLTALFKWGRGGRRPADLAEVWSRAKQFAWPIPNVLWLLSFHMAKTTVHHDNIARLIAFYCVVEHFRNAMPGIQEEEPSVPECVAAALLQLLSRLRPQFRESIPECFRNGFYLFSCERAAPISAFVDPLVNLVKKHNPAGEEHMALLVASFEVCKDKQFAGKFAFARDSVAGSVICGGDARQAARERFAEWRDVPALRKIFETIESQDETSAMIVELCVAERKHLGSPRELQEFALSEAFGGDGSKRQKTQIKTH